GEGGYPYWHCELYPRDARAETLHRHLLWTLYLNDDFAEGETEFLFQQRKVKPRTGSLLVAPTAFTHTHRGNRPQGGDKFIATSWILFQSADKLYG
ncbi:MAG: 2OG-Fe(II) oxygenase, partial [Pseudoxanthomonas sp.]